MSLADARVEIIADLSRFRADLRDQMADIAESAGRLLEKRMGKSLENIQDNVKKLGGTIRSELGNASRDALKGFDEAHNKSTENAKRNYKSVATAYSANMRNANNVVAKEIDERTTRVTRDARALWKAVGKQIESSLVEAAQNGEFELKKRMGSAAGRTKDEWRIAGSVIARVLTAGPGESYDDAGLRKFAQALGQVNASAPRARRAVQELGDAVSEVGAGDSSIGRLGDKLEDAIGKGSERGALKARRALKNLALEFSEQARTAAQATEDTLRRSRGVYTAEVREAIRVNAEIGAKAAQGAREAADTAAKGAGEVADSTARAASRAAAAAENAARRSAAAMETSLGKSRSAFSRTLDFIDRESNRRGKNAGYNFADGFKFSVTAGIGSAVGRVIALAALIVPFLSPIASVLLSAAGAATALGSALGTTVVGGAIAAAAAVAAIGSAFLTVKAASGGILNAVKQKALSDKSDVTAAGQTTTSTRSSRRAVENATQNVDSTQRSYARSVREASDAERDARIARGKLTDAYREAQRALEDYDNAVKDTANDEADAIVKAKDAHEQLRLAYSKRTTPKLELEKLQVAANEADQKVVETKQKSQRAVEDKSTADAKGVEGSDEVVAAKRAIVEADQKVLDSQQAVKDAALAVANAIRDRNDAIADSADKAAGSASSANKLLDDMIKKLSPNARTAYYAIVGIQDAWKDATKIISNSLFAKAGPEIDKLGKVYLPEVAGSMNEIAKRVNTAGLGFGKFLRRADNVARVKSIFRSNEEGVSAFSQALQPLAHIFLILGEALAPYEKRVGQLVAKLLEMADAYLIAAEKSGALKTFLETAYDDFLRVLRIIGLFGRGVINVFTQGNAKGQDFLRSIENIAQRFLDFTKSDKGREKILAWFTEAGQTAKALKDLMIQVKDAFGILAGDTDPSDFIYSVRETVYELGRLFDQMNEGATGTGIIDTLNGFLRTLADNNAGGAIKSFIDTLGEIVDNVNSLVGVVHDVASVFPGGNEALHEFVVLMGTLAAIKFASSIVGLGSLFGTISSTRAKIAGATNAIKVFRAASAGLEVAEGAAAASPIANLIGKGVSKTKAGVKAVGRTLFPGPPIERIGKASKLADAASAGADAADATSKGFFAKIKSAGAAAASAGARLGSAVADGAKAAGSALASAGASLGSKLTGGIKAAGSGAKKVGSAIASRARDVIKTGDRGAITLGARVARSAGAAADVADVAADAGKTGAVSKIAGAAKGAASSVAALTTAMAANTAAAARNGAAWVANAAKIVATRVAMVATRVATVAYTAVQWLLNAAMAANPIGLVVLAIVALVALFVLAYKKSDKFREIVDKLWEGMKRLAGIIGSALKDAFDFVVEWGGKLATFFRELPGKIVAWLSEKLDQLKDIGKKLISKFLEGLEALGNAELSFGKKLANGLIRALNSVLDFLNDGLAKIPTALTFGVKLHIPTIPELAAGAIVERRTLAYIGEAGKEVVIPLTRPARARELAEQSGLTAMLQLTEMLPSPRPPQLPQPPAPAAAVQPPPVDRSVHVENLHVHHNGQDTARATEKALRRVARLAMS